MCYFKWIQDKDAHKKQYEKVLKIFFKQVVAEFCIFCCLDLASAQSRAISFPVKKNTFVFPNLYKKVSLFFLYLLNQSSYIAAQKKQIKAQKVYFKYLKSYDFYSIIVSIIFMPFWKISNTWWIDDMKT